LGAFIGALFAGCAGSASEASSSTMPAWGSSFDQRRAHEERANSTVKVRGIEGTMSSYDVRDAMERRNDEFAACHEPRASVVPVLSGSIEFGIQVFPDGRVGRVIVRASDLGDRVLERCFVEVITSKPFPRPNGGEANVTYTMLLEPAGSSDAEAWEPSRLERLLAKREPTLRETCGIEGAASVTVTAYVNGNGRVIAAGVAGADGMTNEQFDCIADDLRSWPMPKARKRWAKVSFALR
jgi:hypothetical protein